INVIREEIPRSRPDRLTGLATGQVESVNGGATGGIALNAPLGPLAIRGEISGRTAGNTQTPLGELPTTHIEGYNGGTGVGWITPSGYIGVSARRQELLYGVPGTFNGEVIPGGHVGGVEIDTQRSTLRLQGALTGRIGPFEGIEADA